MDRATASLALLAAALLLAPPATAAEIHGVSFAPGLEWRGTPLRLHGVGLLRYRLVFKGYVAGLYLGEQVEPERVLGDVPRRLEIEYFWSIPANAFAEATTDEITRTAGSETALRVRGEIERLNALYRDVEPGDRYSLTYVPGVGTELALNGQTLGVVAGAEFSQALFGIWLGDEPLDEALRDQLLARS